MGKIRVMHVMQSLEIGGLENGVVNLVNNMDPAVFDFYICCIRREGVLKSRLKNEVKVICMNEKEGFHLSSAVNFAKLCKEYKIDIVHTHGWAGGLYTGVVGGKISGVPVIINGEHGVFYLEKKSRFLAQKILFGMTDKIIPVSNDLKNDILTHFKIKSDKINAILNGVNIDKFKPDIEAGSKIRKELGINENDIVIGSVGRLEPVKDYQSLIKAAEKISNKIPGMKIVFVGDGSIKDELKQLSESTGLKNNIIFTGARNDISAVLNIFDIFVLCSIDEGLSNTILEAMAVGKPVIATRVGGNVELVREGETGCFVPVQNADSLSNEILKLAQDKELRMKMGRAARSVIENEFSLPKMMKNYEEAYKQLFYKKTGSIKG